ncbi:MAG: hypothetical protein D6768_01470 [Chloroflexi bacterium]|nr:MAG: hypothetical protein D6768_01470 [Chloroflexota bacterium]
MTRYEGLIGVHNLRNVQNTPKEDGQGLVEYALILTLVGTVVIAILLLLGPTVGNVFSNVTTNLKHTSAPSSGGNGPTNTFGVSSLNINEFESESHESKAKWTASCSSGPVCTVSVQCVFRNGGTIKGIVNSTTSNPSHKTKCEISSGGVTKVIITVTNAASAGYTWDGVTPSATAP